MKNDLSLWPLRRAERAAAAHALGAQLAHDLGTPMNVILGRASLIADDPEVGDDLRKHGEVIARQVRSLHGLVNAFIGNVRATYASVERKSTDLAPLARAAAAMVEPLVAERGVSLALDLDREAVARVEPLLAVHATSTLLAHAVAIAASPVRLSVDVAEVERPAARRCAPGPYGRFVVELERAADAPEGDPDLALAACEGSLRFLGGYLGIEGDAPRVRYEACVPVL